ncbi:hypothetical protein SEA_BAJUNIPER_52 [Microbacterium phage BAjuniper]|nr:hypothetical protein SEA_BAJUNIPER_52 [Microbacterium phage BAjuniper]
MNGDETIKLGRRIRRARGLVNERRATSGRKAFETRQAEATLAYLEKRARALFR